MEDNSNRKISSFLIYPGFQLRYVAWITFSGLTLSACYFGIFYYFINENYYALVELGLVNDETKLQLYNELHSIVYIMTGFTVLFLIIISFISLKFSHKVAGPIFKITDTIAKMRADQKIEHIHLRKKDEFQFLAKEINSLIDYLRKKNNL